MEEDQVPHPWEEVDEEGKCLHFQKCGRRTWCLLVCVRVAVGTCVLPQQQLLLVCRLLMLHWEILCKGASVVESCFSFCSLYLFVFVFSNLLVLCNVKLEFLLEFVKYV